MKRLQKLILIIVLMLLVHSTRSQSFTNPILSGFYPDPSICRVENDYYIVNSSFAYYPGLPIFHSTDLLNWQQIGYALNRPEQLNLDGAGISRGLFAPTIRYHDGLFYILCTLIDKGGNFIVTAKDPKGPWSNPTWLPEVKGIDPSIDFIGDKAYIVYNSDPPENKSLYDGHRTIRMYAFDYKNLKVIGEEKLLINGGTDISKKPIWIEGPHLYKVGDYYYLMCAEGGTGYNHSEVIFRTKSLDEPFVSYQNNPILTQRNLDTARKNPITTTGHADLVQATDGKWWAVFLGCRPYLGDFYNTGRETFMAPVEWKDGWPIINPGFAEVKYAYPIDAAVKRSAQKFSGNYFFKDDFNSSALNDRYSFLRTVRDKWYDVETRPGALLLTLQPQTCSGKENPSMVCFRQSHIKGYAATAIKFTAANENEKAGLMVFQSENYFYFICQSVENGKPVVQLLKGNGKNTSATKPEVIASALLYNKPGKEIYFKIEAKGDGYSFYYALKKNDWRLLKENEDGRFLSTKWAGGFVGSMYAMYATSNGAATTSKVSYNWFECRSEDDVYKK
ncbi:glycoside hydrolase family 43 protein [Ferruginibacter sp. SUN106]|uniref:glycoside hydrolase family 43 protein n=1 Tax=Ferruginibacter sp. SUN106 TaxID=2978348 RepID=UPI003D36D1E2